MANELIGLTDARRNFGALIASVKDGNHVELTEHDHTVAVIIPINEYRATNAHPNA